MIQPDPTAFSVLHKRKQKNRRQRWIFCCGEQSLLVGHLIVFCNVIDNLHFVNSPNNILRKRLLPLICYRIFHEQNNTEMNETLLQIFYCFNYPINRTVVYAGIEI